MPSHGFPTIARGSYGGLFVKRRMDGPWSTLFCCPHSEGSHGVMSTLTRLRCKETLGQRKCRSVIWSPTTLWCWSGRRVWSYRMGCLYQLRHTSPAKRPPCSIFETLPTGNFPFYGFWILGTRGYPEDEEKHSLTKDFKVRPVFICTEANKSAQWHQLLCHLNRNTCMDDVSIPGNRIYDASTNIAMLHEGLQMFPGHICTKVRMENDLAALDFSP